MDFPSARIRLSTPSARFRASSDLMIALRVRVSLVRLARLRFLAIGITWRLRGSKPLLQDPLDLASGKKANSALSFSTRFDSPFVLPSAG